MTLNEQIAKMFGLRPAINTLTGESAVGFEDDSRYFSDDDFSTSMPLAKLLQARMVQDGWRITIHAYTTGYFEAIAYHVKKPRLNIYVSSNSETQAIVALFAKVYNLEGK